MEQRQRDILDTTGSLDLHDIPGQWHVKRALEVAAAGRHHILLIGPDGEGSAQLALSLRSIFPHPRRSSRSGISRNAFVREPTLPGALTLAHGSVLFLKDLDTFESAVLTTLTQTVETNGVCIPLQEGPVAILVATIKPCPCGWTPCRCPVEEIARYRQPLKDMIRNSFAIEVEVPLAGYDTGSVVFPEESSATILQRVERVREIQQRRYAETMHLQVNADLLSASDVERYCAKVAPAEDLLKSALRQLHLTPLEVLRVQAVARTVADLDNSALIAGKHMAEAIRYLSGFVRDE